MIKTSKGYIGRVLILLLISMSADGIIASKHVIK